jgi:hypothetical protein
MFSGLRRKIAEYFLEVFFAELPSMVHKWLLFLTFFVKKTATSEEGFSKILFCGDIQKAELKGQA